MKEGHMQVIVYETKLHRIVERKCDDHTTLLTVEKKDVFGNWKGTFADFDEAMAVIEEYHGSQDNVKKDD